MKSPQGGEDSATSAASAACEVGLSRVPGMSPLTCTMATHWRCDQPLMKDMAARV